MKRYLLNLLVTVGLFSCSVSSQSKEYYGCIDKTGKIVVPFKFEDISEFKEGLATFSLTNREVKKYGYINKAGKVVIPAVFDFAADFSDGMAWVAKDRGIGSSGIRGYIDRSGKLVIPYQYEEATNFKESRAFIAKKFEDKSGVLYALISKKGKLLTDFKFQLAEDSSEGLSAVATDGEYYGAKLSGEKWGFIDLDGKVVVPNKYDSVDRFNNGFAIVGFFDPKDKYIFNHTCINKAGTKVDNSFCTRKLEYIWDDIFNQKRFVGFEEPPLKSDLITKENAITGKWGYEDSKTGKLAIPYQFSFANEFSEGLACVRGSGNIIK